MDKIISVATKNFSGMLEELARFAERELQVLAQPPTPNDDLTPSHMEAVVEYLNTITMNAIQLKTLLDVKQVLGEDRDDQ